MTRAVVIGVFVLLGMSGCGATIRTHEGGLITIDSPADRQLTIIMPENNRSVICAGLTTRVVFNRARSGSLRGAYLGTGATVNGMSGDEAVELTGGTETTRILEIALSWICQQSAAKQLGPVRIERMFKYVLDAYGKQENRKTAEAVTNANPQQTEVLKDVLKSAEPPPAGPAETEIDK